MTHFRYWQKNSHSVAKNPLGLLTHLPKHSDTSSQQTPKQKYSMKTLQAKNGGGFVYRMMSSIIAVETRRKCGCVCLLLYSLLYVENVVKKQYDFFTVALNLSHGRSVWRKHAVPVLWLSPTVSLWWWWAIREMLGHIGRVLLQWNANWFLYLFSMRKKKFYFQIPVFVFFDDFNFDMSLHCRDRCSYLPLTDTTKVEHSSNN